MSGVGDQLYSGAAELGQFRTTISLFIAIFIGIIFVIIGIILLTKKNVHTTQVSATVVSGNCIQILDKNNSSHSNCNLIVSYTYNGQNYPTCKLNTSGPQYVPGNTIDIFVDPNHPEDYSLESLQSDRVSGWILIGAAIFIVAIAYLTRWLSQRYKFFAAAEGVGLGANIIGGGFRGSMF